MADEFVGSVELHAQSDYPRTACRPADTLARSKWLTVWPD